MRVLITRPREDSSILAEIFAGSAIETLVDPLIDIDFTSGPELALEGVQALLMTSANGVRAFCRRSDDRSLPVYAVGDATARTAEENGFAAVLSADGDVGSLAGLVCREAAPENGRLLHCAGTAIAGDLAARLERHGYACQREVLYCARTAERLSREVINAFENDEINGVLLFSPRTAEVFARLIDLDGLGGKLDCVTAYCLSDNVDRKIAHLGWRRRRVAQRPRQDELVSSVTADQQE